MLERTPDIDIVLMDIMMPVMDGYETMRAIRAIDRFATLPIIAVTGKVVPGERQRCLDAGANDYVPEAGRHRRAPRRPRALAAGRRGRMHERRDWIPTARPTMRTPCRRTGPVPILVVNDAAAKRLR